MGEPVAFRLGNCADFIFFDIIVPQVLLRTLALISLLVISSAVLPSTQAWPAELEHIIVLYLENWSFDGLFGTLNGVEGIRSEAAKASPPQTDKDGVVYTVLPQDPNKIIPLDQPNTLVNFEDLVNAYPGTLPPSDVTHRYFHEQYQINNNKMDRFVAWCNSKAIAYSYFDLSQQYFGQLAQNYTILDRFFHSAFGGSMLNHQWLISARTPLYPFEVITTNDTLYNAMVSTFNNVTGYVEEDNPVFHNLTTDLFWVVNHCESQNPPLNPRTQPIMRIPSQNHPTIGDKLSEVGISWKWYSGGYNNAMQGIDSDKFNYHHQPFTFFDRFKEPYSFDRVEHLQDEVNLLRDLQIGNLPKISWWKPYGAYNFHPGSANQNLKDSQAKLSEIVTAIQNSPYWKKCAIIITFDENGGRWDHVVPPKGDNWGPGSRIPATVVSPFVQEHYVDHTQYETLSILKFIEEFAGVNGTIISPERYPLVKSLGELFQPLPQAAPTTPSFTPKEKETVILGTVIPTAILASIFFGGLAFIRLRHLRLTRSTSTEALAQPIITPNEDQQTFYAATDYTAFGNDSAASHDVTQ